MSNFTYENQGTNTYLVYEISNEDIVDSMSFGMLTNNKIPGLAQTFFTQIDNKKLIRYNVSSRVSVAQFFRGVVNKKRLLGVFSGIVDAMLAVEDYMIDVNSIVLDLEYIYTDVSSCETVLICLPIENPKISNPELGMFFKQIMFSTQFDQTEKCDHVAKIINYLNSSPVFYLNDFKKLLDEIKNGGNTQTLGVNSIPETKVETPAVQQQPVVPQQNMVASSLPSYGQANTSKNNSIPSATPFPVPSQQISQGTIPPAQSFPQTGASLPQTGTSLPQTGASLPQAGVAGNDNNEKGMSWFYLMQHYNKENAAAYKAQKEARKKKPTKNGKSASTPSPATTNNNFGYAVPGAPVQQPSASPMPASTPTPTPTQTSTSTSPYTSIPISIPTAAPVNTQKTPQSPAVQPAQPQVGGFNASTFGQPVAQPVSTIPQGQPMNFGETTVLGGGSMGETTVLDAIPMAVNQKPYLIRLKNNEKITIDKPVFIVGKEKSYVDYFIGDNPAISRSHANFIERGGEYFVIDTNSTNHTYVNGVMAQSNVETKIKHGDKICLANEDFEFNNIAQNNKINSQPATVAQNGNNNPDKLSLLKK